MVDEMVGDFRFLLPIIGFLRSIIVRIIMFFQSFFVDIIPAFFLLHKGGPFNFGVCYLFETYQNEQT